jgi:uncharacterized protein (TIGR02284 family)
MRSEALFQEYDGSQRGQAVAALSAIIEVCRDGALGYARAAEDVRDPWLKQLFWDYSNQRRKFATALERELIALGGHSEPHLGMAGRIHRKWLEVRSSLEHGSALAMLLECERGENAARVKYEHALQVPMPTKTQDLLLAQLAEIREAHDRLDRMRGSTVSLKLTSG